MSKVLFRVVTLILVTCLILTSGNGIAAPMCIYRHDSPGAFLEEALSSVLTTPRRPMASGARSEMIREIEPPNHPAIPPSYKEESLSIEEISRLTPSYPSAESYFVQYLTRRAQNLDSVFLDLTRHPVSTSNLFRYIQDYETISPPTIHGEEQILFNAVFMRRMRERFGVRFDRFLSSDLERASKAIEKVAAEEGKRVEIKERFREVKIQPIGGITHEQAGRLFPGALARFSADPWAFAWWPHFSGRKLRKYVKLFVEEIIQAGDKNILVASHGMTILLILLEILDIPSKKYLAMFQKLGNPPNMGITLLAYHPSTKKWELLVYGDDSYLPKELRGMTKDQADIWKNRIRLYGLSAGRAIARPFMAMAGKKTFADYFPPWRLFIPPTDEWVKKRVQAEADRLREVTPPAHGGSGSPTQIWQDMHFGDEPSHLRSTRKGDNPVLRRLEGLPTTNIAFAHNGDRAYSHDEVHRQEALLLKFAALQSGVAEMDVREQGGHVGLFAGHEGTVALLEEARQANVLRGTQTRSSFGELIENLYFPDGLFKRLFPQVLDTSWERLHAGNLPAGRPLVNTTPMNIAIQTIRTYGDGFWKPKPLQSIGREEDETAYALLWWGGREDIFKDQIPAPIGARVVLWDRSIGRFAVIHGFNYTSQHLAAVMAHKALGSIGVLSKGNEYIKQNVAAIVVSSIPDDLFRRTISAAIAALFEKALDSIGISRFSTDLSPDWGEKNRLWFLPKEGLLISAKPRSKKIQRVVPLGSKKLLIPGVSRQSA